MKNKIFLLALIAVVAVMVAVVSNPSATNAAPSTAEEETEEVVDACAGCHEDLAEVVSEDHPRVFFSEVKYCLVCHAVDGPAAAFTWKTHFNHYKQEDFEGDCLSCHVISEDEAELQVIGATVAMAEDEEDKEAVEEEDEEEEEATVEATATVKVSPTATTKASPATTATPAAKASPSATAATKEAEAEESATPTATPVAITEELLEDMAPYFQSWANSEFLGHTHALAGVTCELCHGVSLPEKKVAMEQCFQCHGSYALVAQLTETEPNPHNSHLGPVECSSCHKMHEESELYCNGCHMFDLEMP